MSDGLKSSSKSSPTGAVMLPSGGAGTVTPEPADRQRAFTTGSRSKRILGPGFIGRVLLIAFLCVIGIAVLAPVWTMVVTALTPEGLVFIENARLWPAQISRENFDELSKDFPFLRWYWNSVTTASLFTLGQLFSCSVTAFALSFFRFRGREVLLVVVLATMMLPFQVLMVPLFWLMKNLHLTNNLAALWLPAFFGDVTGAFGIFLLRQAFLQIPRDLAEAAVIDGANPATIFLRIYLPLATPFLAVLTVFSFMTSWNDFVRPIVYITDISNMTVTGGLSYFQTQFHVSWGPLMAGALAAMAPTLCLYVLAQRYFIRMAVATGLKG
jgi:multiple sugar transport system permease protein